MKRSIYAAFLVFALTTAYVVAQTTSGTQGTTSDQMTTQSTPGTHNSTASPNTSESKSKTDSMSASPQNSQQIQWQVQQQLSSDPAYHKVRDHLTVNASAGSATPSNNPSTAANTSTVGGTAGTSATSSTAIPSSSENTAGSIAGNTAVQARTANGPSSTVGNSSTTSAVGQTTPSANTQTSGGTAPSSASMGNASAVPDNGSSARTQQDKIEHAINQELANSKIQVTQTANHIVLSGTVSTEADRQRAENIAKQLAPSAQIVNQINVSTSTSLAPSSSTGVGSSRSAASMGAATGTGSSASISPGASSTTQTGAASGSIGSNTSASGTTSGQTSEATPGASASAGMSTGASPGSSSDLQTKIQNALAQQNLTGVTVSVTDTTINVSGTVPTSKDRTEAKRIAQSCAQNRKVTDHITVNGQANSSVGTKPSSGSSSSSDRPRNEKTPSGINPNAGTNDQPRSDQNIPH